MSNIQTRIEQAFEAVPRKFFLPIDKRGLAFLDEPISLGSGATNSQPTTVKLMLNWLAPEIGDKVLDVGAGSGWTSGLLGYLVGEKGRVAGVEILPELLALGQKNCQQLKMDNVVFHLTTAELGWPGDAPYGRILVSAAAEELPEELLDQLKPGGKMVIPIRDEIWEIFKKKNSELKIIRHPGFVFVPLIR